MLIGCRGPSLQPRRGELATRVPLPHPENSCKKSGKEASPKRARQSKRRFGGLGLAELEHREELGLLLRRDRGLDLLGLGLDLDVLGDRLTAHLFRAGDHVVPGHAAESHTLDVGFAVLDRGDGREVGVRLLVPGDQGDQRAGLELDPLAAEGVVVELDEALGGGEEEGRLAVRGADTGFGSELVGAHGWLLLVGVTMWA
jgi:hypothetical protein